MSIQKKKPKILRKVSIVEDEDDIDIEPYQLGVSVSGSLEENNIASYKDVYQINEKEEKNKKSEENSKKEEKTSSELKENEEYLGTEFYWNKVFQETIHSLQMSDPESDTAVPTLQQKISSIETEFITSAKRFGKIIINEIFVPIEKKTIKPSQIGGLIGKNYFFIFFIFNFILFFYVRWRKIFGFQYFIQVCY